MLRRPLLHAALTESVIGAFYEVYRELGFGFLEHIYVLALERELKELEKKIKEVRRSASAALTLEEKLAVQKEVKALESQRNEKRKRLFDAQDDVDRRRGELIEQIEAKLRQDSTFEELFTIRWSLCA